MPHAKHVHNVTLALIETFAECAKRDGAEFEYTADCAPRRMLTKPVEPAEKGGCVNIEGAYLCRVGDELISPEGHIYSMLENLGSGTFGQVIECTVQCPTGTREMEVELGKVALKIVKNKRDYQKAARDEIAILEHLQKKLSREARSGFVHLAAGFVHRGHTCLAFELLNMNLLEVLRNNRFRGLNSQVVAMMTKQLLEALSQLKRASVMHCDLKPENVALADLTSGRVKILDFGLACLEGETRSFYVQSRFYRAPEVIIGVPYDSAIDMWSLGTLIAELHNGTPVFPGAHSYDQLRRIIACLSRPSNAVLKAGRYTKRFFHIRSAAVCDSGASTECSDSNGLIMSKTQPPPEQYHLKTCYEFEEAENKKPKAGRKELRTFESIEEIVVRNGLRSTLSDEVRDAELERRRLLKEFLTGALVVEASDRWTPDRALQHAHAANAEPPSSD
jgi:dual specificity protein kinase YAK1